MAAYYPKDHIYWSFKQEEKALINLIYELEMPYVHMLNILKVLQRPMKKRPVRSILYKNASQEFVQKVINVLVENGVLDKCDMERFHTEMFKFITNTVVYTFTKEWKDYHHKWGMTNIDNRYTRGINRRARAMRK